METQIYLALETEIVRSQERLPPLITVLSQNASPQLLLRKLTRLPGEDTISTMVMTSYHVSVLRYRWLEEGDLWPIWLVLLASSCSLTYSSHSHLVL